MSPSIIQALTQIDKDRLASKIISLNSSNRLSKPLPLPHSCRIAAPSKSAALPTQAVQGWQCPWASVSLLLCFAPGITMNFAAQLIYSRVLKNRTPRDRYREDEDYDPFWQRLESVAVWLRTRAPFSLQGPRSALRVRPGPGLRTWPPLDPSCLLTVS